MIRKLSIWSCLETGMQCKITTYIYIYIYIYINSLKSRNNSDIWGTSLANQNSIHEEIKCRLQLRNVCYYSVHNCLSSSLLSKNIKVKIYRIIILHFVLYGCHTWSPTVCEEHRLRMCGSRVLRKIFGPTRDKVVGEC